MPFLTGTRKRELHRALQSCFTDADDVEIFLSFHCDENLKNICPPNSKLSMLLFCVLNYFESNGRLAKLANELMAEFPDNQIVQHACQNILEILSDAQGMQGSPDPFDVVLLPGGQPFVNRRQLRDHVRVLSSRHSQRVAGVSGSTGSGKSYSVRYIAHVIQSLGNDRIIWFQATEDTRALVEPEELVNSIFRQIGKSTLLQYMPSKNNTNLSRWVVELRDWIIGELNQTELAKEGNVWWLVVDGICDEDVPERTRELVKHLCKSAHVNVPCLRVVLLDATAEFFPADILSAVAKEQISAIGQPEVQEYFEKLASSGHLRINSAGISAAVNKVFSVSPNGSLAKLSATLEAVTKTLSLTEEQA